MRRRFDECAPLSLLALLLVFGYGASAQNTPTVLTQDVDESRLVALPGNTRPEANSKNDRGPVGDNFLIEHVMLLLKRSPAQQRRLDLLIEALHDSSSPDFHRWLTATELGKRFGVAKQDRIAIEKWLASHGLKINVDYPSGVFIDFSGTAAQIHDAFHTGIHHLDVKGEKHIANMSDPQIPAALAPVIAGVVSLNDFRPHPAFRARAAYTVAENGAENYLVVPGDLATIYNLNPLFSEGISGQGQTIVVIEDTDIYSADDWASFRTTFGLSSYTGGSFTQIHPTPPSGSNNCSDPGAIAGDTEASLDAEYASASAPSAAIMLASCTSTSATFGGLIALQNLLNASTTPPALVSMSYVDCEASNGASSNAAFNSTFEQAVTEGVSVFVAAGDNAAAECDKYDQSAMYGIAISGWGSSPHDVAVGGTDFGDTFAGTSSIYWNATDSATYGSALSYIPEIPWDNSCASPLIAEFYGSSETYGSSGFCNSSQGQTFLNTIGGGGGPSGCANGKPSEAGVVSGTCAGWPKPSYQSLLGNPKDGVRDIPDLSLFAANGVWLHAYPFCFSGPGGVPCTEPPVNWLQGGGTSFSAPIMAGIQALVNQKVGARQGNPNYVYYKLAAGEYGKSGSSSCNSTLGNAAASSCIFYDVTQGSNDVDCIAPQSLGTNNCYLASASIGVLSTSNGAYQPAYATATGWDFATGIGTVNAYNLVNSWPLDYILTASPASLTIPQGDSGAATITITPADGFTGSVTLSATSLPNGVTTAFSPNPATSSSTVSFTASATAATGTAIVNINGKSGSVTQTVPIKIKVVADYVLSAAPVTLSVFQGASGTSIITITPANGFNGSVTFSASGLPSGVSAAFSPNPGTSTTMLTLTASTTAAIGTAAITITGASGSSTQSATLQLTVSAAPSYNLSASPSTVSVTQSGNSTCTMTIIPANGFNGSVTLSASGLPSGVTAAFSANPATSTSTLTLTTSATATTGTAAVTITGTSGSLTESTTIQLTVNPTPGYTLSSSPGVLSVAQGNSGTTVVTITPSNNFSRSVTLSASSLPSGVTAVFSPNPATATSTLTLTASATASTGTTTVAITGASGSVTQSTTISLTITGTAAPSFTLSDSPASLTIAQLSQGTSKITITPSSEFNSDVTLTASGLPNGVTASFSPSPATLSSTMTLAASATAPTGTTTVTITGTSGVLTTITTLKLTLNYGLTLLASPNSVSVAQGNTGATAVIITPQNRPVNFSVSGLPIGVTASFSQNPAVDNTVLTFTVGAAAAVGTSTITVTGTEDGLTATTKIGLTIGPLGNFSLNAAPSPVTVTKGSTATTTITVVPTSGFDQEVTLEASGLPIGVTASFSPNPTTTTSTLKLAVNSSAAGGISTITVSGGYESLLNELGVGLIVQ
jgi:uncharacterized membrane protein